MVIARLCRVGLALLLAASPGVPRPSAAAEPAVPAACAARWVIFSAEQARRIKVTGKRRVASWASPARMHGPLFDPGGPPPEVAVTLDHVRPIAVGGIDTDPAAPGGALCMYRLSGSPLGTGWFAGPRAAGGDLAPETVFVPVSSPFAEPHAAIPEGPIPVGAAPGTAPAATTGAKDRRTCLADVDTQRLFGGRPEDHWAIPAQVVQDSYAIVLAAPDGHITCPAPRLLGAWTDADAVATRPLDSAYVAWFDPRSPAAELRIFEPSGDGFAPAGTLPLGRQLRGAVVPAVDLGTHVRLRLPAEFDTMAAGAPPTAEALAATFRVMVVASRYGLHMLDLKEIDAAWEDRFGSRGPPRRITWIEIHHDGALRAPVYLEAFGEFGSRRNPNRTIEERLSDSPIFANLAALLEAPESRGYDRIVLVLSAWDVRTERLPPLRAGLAALPDPRRFVVLAERRREEEVGALERLLQDLGTGGFVESTRVGRIVPPERGVGERLADAAADWVARRQGGSDPASPAGPGFVGRELVVRSDADGVRLGNLFYSRDLARLSRAAHILACALAFPAPADKRGGEGGDKQSPGEAAGGEKIPETDVLALLRDLDLAVDDPTAPLGRVLVAGLRGVHLGAAAEKRPWSLPLAELLRGPDPVMAAYFEGLRRRLDRANSPRHGTCGEILLDTQAQW